MDDFTPSKPATNKTPSKPTGPAPKPLNEIGAASLKTSSSPKPAAPPKTIKFWKWELPRLIGSSKKQWLIGGLIVVLLASGGFFGYKYLVNKFKVGKSNETALERIPPKPKVEPARLSGVPVDPELNKRPVTGVMIENSPDARPQSSLGEAGIVFEAIAEGGITRFLALYQTEQPKNIGPVRSVRPYYLDWLMPFDAAIAHAGGSAQGLNDISSLGVKDLNHNSTAFRRVSNRFAPHNLYTSSSALDEYSKSKGYTTSDFKPWPRTEKELPATTPDAKTIELNISGFNYNPKYEYDAGTNSYKRFLAGQEHKDENTGKAIMPKVVIALVINRTQNGIYSVYKTTGSGNLVVFQNGTLTRGTWSKPDRRSQYIFKDQSGNEIKLNAGLNWVSVVSADNAIIVK